MCRWAKVWGLAGVLLAVSGSYARAAEFPFQDPSLPIEQRVADLVGLEAASYTIFLGGGQPGQSAGVEGQFAI